MNTTHVPFFLQMLIGQGPTLLAAIAGLVVSIVLHRRAPAASKLAGWAWGIWILVAVVQSIVQGELMRQLRSTMMPMAQYSSLSTVIGLAGGVIRAGAMGMLIAAVYVGRPQSELGGGFPMNSSPR